MYSSISSILIDLAAVVRTWRHPAANQCHSLNSSQQPCRYTKQSRNIRREFKHTHTLHKTISLMCFRSWVRFWWTVSTETCAKVLKFLSQYQIPQQRRRLCHGSTWLVNTRHPKCACRHPYRLHTWVCSLPGGVCCSCRSAAPVKKWFSLKQNHITETYRPSAAMLRSLCHHCVCLYDVLCIQSSQHVIYSTRKNVPWNTHPQSECSTTVSSCLDSSVCCTLKKRKVVSFSVTVETAGVQFYVASY